MRRIAIPRMIALLLALILTWSDLGFSPWHLLAMAHAAQLSESASVRIGVLGLFHSKEFTVSALPENALVVHAGNEQLVLESIAGPNSASIQMSAHGVLLSSGARTIHADAVSVTGRNGNRIDFLLAVPGKITRHYTGTLAIQASTGELAAIVTMDRETAVASVVAAEQPPDAPIEALKAQAVATRSYLVASRGRHGDFDFCDSTHCQFLREPPNAESAAFKAAMQTRNLVLAYNHEPFAAMYTRSCSGRTHTPAEVKLATADYPYYSVSCSYCRSHPVHWRSRLSGQDASALHASDEPLRLLMGRRLGWHTIQSNDFVLRKEGDQALVQGTGQGHGIGLCQAGARGMAERGSDFREILLRYYPNTTVIRWPPSN